MSRLDPRDPLVIDIRDLARRPGQMRTLERSAPAPAGLGVDVINVPKGHVLDLLLRLESVVEGVLVSGTCRATAVGECVRCLGPVGIDLDLDIQELFAYPDTSAAEAEELAHIEDDQIDLSPTLHDLVVLGLPLQPLCRVDCLGLCATCGIRLEDAPDHYHEEVDPRWAGLRDLYLAPEASEEKRRA